ncbi:MAG: acyl-CoA dehydrogenase family protein [Elusimicrobia bacterium]|nr:acyl-CoA dehydrogenase family protein [Elusimicrobiota bacterium]
MIDTAIPLAAVANELDEVRQRLAREVAATGEDAHQVAMDHLVWAHAHVRAASAMREWSERTGDAAVDAMAAAAEATALADVRGHSLDQAVADDLRLASIGTAPPPFEDLGGSADHRLLRSTLRDFADREIAPIAQAVHRNDANLPEHVITGVARLGLFVISIPEEYGGSRQERPDTKAMLIATEELSRASLCVGGSLMTRPEILVRALLTGGTEDQRRVWLPAIASGAQLVAVAVTEPDQGSNVAEVKCRARRLPSGDWELTGAKLWCTFAGRAELLTVLCRTGEGGHRGLSLCALEKPAFPGHEFEHVQPEGGVLRGRAIPTLGYGGMHSFELVFDHYRAPAGALVGGEAGIGRGFYLQMEGFAVGRLQTAARAVGLMQAALEAARSRTPTSGASSDAPEKDLQLVRAKLGAIAVRTSAARQLSYRAAKLSDAGDGQVDASLTKLYASRMAELVTREVMQLHGGMGYAEETDVSRHFVDARVLAIFEGTEEVLSLRVIGRSLLRAP